MNNYVIPSFFTEEQKRAITLKGKNIIVSAGAGSGKTAVLKERVLRILLDDYFSYGKKVHVSNLIILTFTKNAAFEMKERIRKIISKQNLSSELEALDSAYITTFDSFAQSIVKKYNYLLNMPKDFTIVDESIVNIEINKILDSILESYYECDDDKFHKLIESFCVKNDTEIRTYIIKVYKHLENIIDADDYISTYITNYYKKEYVDSTFEEYTNNIFKIKDDVVLLLNELESETLNEDKRISNSNNTLDFISSSSYDELIDTLDFSLERASKGVYSDEGKNIKSQISDLIKKMKSFGSLKEKDLKDKYMLTKDSVEVILDIVKELGKRVTAFKENNNSYDYVDISLKAIKLVSEYEEVRNEIKNNTYEIMIDEYQDTNDIQEKFISYIENNNVYMVGDIKQSIYRFRNANPYIFMNKYNLYKDGNYGYRIDLTKNFRSREEVISSINKMFSNIMTIDVGGANYKEEHQMQYGNKDYEIKGTQDYNSLILSYNMDEYKKEYSSPEIESFIIANDINNRILSKEQILDNKVLRDITYKDFCILVDKSKNFETVKKILEYNKIPTTIDKDISIKEDDEIFILKNIINLIILIKEHKESDSLFKHCYVSVERSYVCSTNDNEIFNNVINNTIEYSDLYKKCFELTNIIDSMSNKEILINIIDKFDIVNKLVLVGNVNERLTKLEYFINNSISLNNFGMDIYDMLSYFNEILNNEEDIKMHTSIKESNSVKIMTIHGSKGLEYSYVYLPLLNSDFTRSASGNSRFIIDNKYGLITPFFSEGIGNTYMNTLHASYEYLEELSERIRLFYVAITRAKEKVIMINSYSDEEKKLIYSNLTSVKSYKDILELLKNISNIKEVNVSNINISKDYNLIRDINYKKHIKKVTKKQETTNKINIDSCLLNSSHFSKPLTKLMDKELKYDLDYGTYMHYLFEIYDFNNPNNNNLDTASKEKINDFLSHKEVSNIKEANIYKEYEIKFVKDDVNYHGFIDLPIEYSDHFDIVDYKLSNVEGDEYINQLKGYKSYIESHFLKNTNIYLYSINKDEFKKID